MGATVSGFVAAEVRAVGTAGLDQPEHRAALDAAGVSAAFLDAVRGHAAGLSARLRQRPGAPPWCADPHLSGQLCEAISAARDGRKLSLSPFSGELVAADACVGPNAFVVRESGRACLVLQWNDLSAAKGDTVWFFPDDALLLFCSDVHTAEAFRWGLGRLLHDLAALAPEVAAAAVAPAPPSRTILYELDNAHIGHHIWNVLSGWDEVFRLVPPERLAGVAMARHSRLLGGVAELYADKLTPATEALTYGDWRELALIGLRRGAQIVSMENSFISADLAARIQARAERLASPAFHEELARLRAASDPLLLITLRLGNRAWAEQEEGYIALVRALREEWPRLGVAIDGLNAEFRPGSGHSEDTSLREEQAVSARVAAALEPSGPVFDSVGCTLLESIALAARCDLFVAPVGAGMAKSRWIANLDGVAFSNTTFLQPGDWNGHLYDFCREGARAATYLDPSEVEDTPGYQWASRANFSLDWRRLHARTREFLLARRAAAPATAAE